MAVNPSPFGPKPQIELGSGVPMVGGLLFTYVGGSVATKVDTYTDSTGAAANTNPIVLNARGETTAEVWLTAGTEYKFVLAPVGDTDPPTSPIWTIDHLKGINDTVNAASEWVAGPAPTFIGATQFSLVGDQTAIFTVGRRVMCAVTAGTSYGMITASAFGGVATVVTVDTFSSNPLDAGLSAVSYGLLSSVNVSTPNQELIATATGAAATYDFVNLTGYAAFLFVLENVIPSNAAVTMLAQVTTNNGGAWQNADYANAINGFTSANAAADYGSAVNTGVILSNVNTMDNAQPGASGTVLLTNPAVGLGLYKWMETHIGFFDGTDYNVACGAGCWIGGLQNVNGVRFIFGAGTITSGTIRCYGIRRV